MPKVLNKHRHGQLAGSVYIGRPGKWGNPFVVGRDGGREQVVALYRRWIMSQSRLLGSLGELRGRDLVCYCAPLPCHGDVLLKLANEIRPGERGSTYDLFG
jgi:hypothetical protein